MPKYNIGVRFLRVSLEPDDWTGFVDVLAAMFQTQGLSRLLTIRERDFLLAPFDDRSGYHFGLARARTRDWPYQMTEQGTLVEIDETIGKVSEQGHFLFVPRRRLLVIYYSFALFSRTCWNCDEIS